MSQQVSVLCPMCGAGMTLKDRSKLGKKASCPNCSNLFVLTEAEDDPVPLPSRGRRSEEAAAPPPRRSSNTISGNSSGQTIKGERTTSGGGSNTGLLVGGGIVALLLLVGVGLWASGIFSGGDNPPADQLVADGGGAEVPAVAAQNKFNLAYLPADAEVFVKLNLAEAWSSPLLMRVASLPNVQQSLQQLQQKFSLSPADVASLTVGASEFSGPAGRPNVANRAAITSAVQEKAVAVFRLNKEVDAASLKLVENGCKELQHDSRTYYLFEPPVDETTNKPRPPVAIFLAESKLIVTGPESQVQAAITSGGKQTRRADLDFVDPDQQLLIVVVPKDKELLKNAIPSGGGPDDPGGEMALVAAQNVQAVGIGLNAGTGLDFKVQANCTDTKAAGELKQILDGLVVEGRSAVKNPEGGVPPFLRATADTVLTTLKSSVDNSTVTASINLSEKTIASLQQAAPLLLLGMMVGNGGPAEPMPTPIDVPTEAPEGIQVSAIARWGEPTEASSDGTSSPPPLELWVYLVGKQPQSAVGWGMLKMDQITGDNEQKLELVDAIFQPDSPIKRFLPVDRTNIDDFEPTHPEQGVRALIRLKNPGKQISTIKQAEGNVSLRIASEQKKVVLKNVLSLVDTEVSDPVVKEAGLRLKVTGDAKSLKLNILEGDPGAISEIYAIDGKGKRIELAFGFRSDDERRPAVGVTFDENPPADTGLELKLNLGLTQVEVPFSVSDIRVPVAPSAPGAPPVTTDGLPEGLTMFAKTGWSLLPDYDDNGKPRPPVLYVAVTLLGETAKKGVDWGFVQLKTATGTDAVPLKLSDRNFRGPDQPHPNEAYVPVARREYGGQNRPNSVRAILILDPPAKPIRDIVNIEGTLKLRTTKVQQAVMLANFPELSGQLLANPELKKAGLSLKLDGKEGDFKLTLVKGDEINLARVEVVTADGDKIPNLAISRRNFRNETVYSIFTFDDKIPAAAVLKLTLNLELTELEVPFHFKDLPVPDLPLK